MFEDYPTPGQDRLLYSLLDRKERTGSVTAKIIALLMDCPDANANGLDLGWIKTEVNEAKRTTDEQ